jgi:hypothetical protein
VVPETATAADTSATLRARSPESDAGSGEPKAAGSVTAPAGTDADSTPLPPVHTLTPESDFTRFFDAKAPVDDALKRAALKALLRDPRFNIMDGLDTYIDDYTRPDPIPEGVLQKLVHAQSFVTPSTETPAAAAAPAAATGPAQLALATDPEAVASHTPADASHAHAEHAPSTSGAPASPTAKPKST